MNLLLNLMFWTLLVADTFCLCYFPVSKLASVLARLTDLSAITESVLVLILSLLLTPMALRALVVLFREEIAEQTESPREMLPDEKQKGGGASAF